MTLHQLFWKLTKEKFTLHEVDFGGAEKYLEYFINNATYHSMNSDADIIYHQTVNLFSSDKSLSTLFLMFNITFDQISATLSVQFW